MPRFRRILVLLVPLAASLMAALVLPGQAQQAPSGRFAFADTTLLRDTLNLHFDGLFQTADSLQRTPDTLRALMIRYRMPIPRLLYLADSMNVPVDSVGVILWRERFNPLAAGGPRQVTTFQWSSGYTIQRTTTDWTNTSIYTLKRGPVYVNNTTNIDLQRITSSGVTTLRQNRDATTESGFTVGRGLSFGGRSHQLRFFSADPGAATTQDENLNEYSLTARAQSRGGAPGPGRAGGARINNELNLRLGYLHDVTSISTKSGLSSGADARSRLTVGRSISHDLSGSLSGNASKVPVTGAPEGLPTHDFSSSMRGNLSMYAAAPVGVNVNYGLRHTRVQSTYTVTSPYTYAGVQEIVNRNNNVDGTLHVRLSNDRYVNLLGSATSAGSPTGSRFDGSGKATLRWMVARISIDANYLDDRARSFYFRQRGTGGYVERVTSRETDALLLRTIGSRFVAKAYTSVSLDRYRYEARSDSASPPTTHDSYHQQYRGELLYTRSDRMNSAIAFEASLNRLINLTPVTTGSNTDTRDYRAEWRWSYRAFPSLTLTQNNQVTADYQRYPFASNLNTLGLTYNSITTLSAVLPGGFSMDLQHNASQSPRGSLVRKDDGLSYLQLSDDSRNYVLYSSLRYQPSPSLGLHVEPRYTANTRSGTTAGVQQRQSGNKSLDMSGGVDLNWRVGRKGTLTGRLSRVFTDQRSLTYQNNVAVPTPASKTDYWSGNMQLTWIL